MVGIEASQLAVFKYDQRADRGEIQNQENNSSPVRN